MTNQTSMIQRVELSCYRLPVHCPFCGDLAFSDDDPPTNFCKHTLFIAHDEAFEYRSERFDRIKNIVGLNDDDVDLGDDGFDAYTDNLKVDNAIKFAVYIPAPSFFGAYFGFAPADDE